jgi:ATP-dependent exoDNAse (exonuclease V) alpha subunit
MKSHTLKKAIEKHGHQSLKFSWKKHGHRGLTSFSGIGKKTANDLEDLFREEDVTSRPNHVPYNLQPNYGNFDKERLSTLLCEKGPKEFRNATFTNTFTAKLPEKTISSFLECVETMSSWSGHDEILKALLKKLSEKCARYKNSRTQSRGVSINDDLDKLPVVFSIDSSTLLDNPWSTLRSLCDLKLNDFKMVDKLALLNNWWDRGSQNRAEMCILTRVDIMIKDTGHTYLNKYTLDEILHEHDIPLDVKETALQQLFTKGSFLSYHTNQFTTHKYTSAELGIAKFIDNNSQSKRIAPESETSECMKNIFDTLEFQVSEEQVQCISNFCEFNMSIITGPGGTGKSEMLKTIIQLAIIYEMNVVVLVPTHQVRKLITKLVSGKLITNDINKQISIETYTHFVYFNTKTLSDSLYIIEEASMADSLQMWQILQRADSDTRIVLCGDASQCRPVGPGAPFFDIWRSNKVPTTELTRVFRAESKEVADFSALFRHNANQFWSLNPSNQFYALRGVDSTYVEAHFVDKITDKEKMLQSVENALRTALQNLRNSGINDDELAIVTPKNDDCKRFHIIRRNVMRNNNDTALYATGDNVMFKINTEFHKNFDRGTIEEVDGNDIYIRYEPDGEEQSALQDEIDSFSDRDEEWMNDNNIILPRHNSMDNTWTIKVNSSEIKPAGAVTVHASQGAQWPYVIAVFYSQYPVLSSADKVYTATSRTKKKMIIIGTQSVWHNTAKPCNNKPRTTLLNLELENSTDNDSPTTQEMEVGRNSRAKIPKAVRYQVWRTYNGEVYNSTCYVCNRNIDIANFHCGHVIAHACGGSTEIDNLRPICMSCNCSMGVRNLHEFKMMMRCT